MTSTGRQRFWAGVAASGALLGGCTAAPPTGLFESDGEILALSGGDAGARNACIACHGLSGEGDGGLAPRLAGMERGYFLRQMELFDAGLRRHARMRAIAGATDGPARLKLADYYQRLPAPPTATSTACPDPAAAELYHSGDPVRGIASCAACHGHDGRGVGAGNPALIGQPAPYLAEQLRKWRSGERYGDPDGTMTALSRRLGEREIAPLADYIAALPDASDRPEPRAACLRARRPGPTSGA